eukprot:352387-Prorocentrum_minimum.AAC.2
MFHVAWDRLKGGSYTGDLPRKHAEVNRVRCVRNRRHHRELQILLMTTSRIAYDRVSVNHTLLAHRMRNTTCSNRNARDIIYVASASIS